MLWSALLAASCEWSKGMDKDLMDYKGLQKWIVSQLLSGQSHFSYTRVGLGNLAQKGPECMRVFTGTPL